MKNDLNEKYRPIRFKEFWNQDGIVKEMMEFLRHGALPKTSIIYGMHGAGKTSLAHVITRSVSCLMPENLEPCCRCEGCDFYLDRIMGKFGAGTLIQGNLYKPEMIRRFADEVHQYPPPERSNAYVAIIDEAQRISEKDQLGLLHILEFTRRTHFILCTTNLNEITEGIRERAQVFKMGRPSQEQAVKAMSRIAQLESYEYRMSDLEQIAIGSTNVPRNCLKSLHYLIVHGKLPVNWEAGGE